MSFSDDWLKNGLPNFSGGKDRTVARKMIDHLGGPTGFKTSMRTNADGSVTTVQLKGDMPPRITTTQVIKKPGFTERDYLTRTYVSVEINFSHNARYGYYKFDYVKTIQVFDSAGAEHTLTFPDPYSADSYAEVLIVAPNKIAKIPVSAPKSAQLSGPTSAAFTFDALPSEVDFFDVVSGVTLFPLSMRKTASLTARELGIVERGVDTVTLGAHVFKFARPEDSL